MKLALSDCHFWNEPEVRELRGETDGNPYKQNEISIGRHINFTLEGLLSFTDIDVTRINVDKDRPQSIETAMKLKAPMAKGCDVMLEPHLNYSPSSRVDGWIIQAKAGDSVGAMLGGILAKHLSEVAGKRIKLMLMPHDGYITSRLFTLAPCPFVLAELGNIGKPDLLKSYLARGPFFSDVARALFSGIAEFRGVYSEAGGTNGKEEKEDTQA